MVLVMELKRGRGTAHHVVEERLHERLCAAVDAAALALVRTDGVERVDGASPVAIDAGDCGGSLACLVSFLLRLARLTTAKRERRTNDMRVVREETLAVEHGLYEASDGLERRDLAVGVVVPLEPLLEFLDEVHGVSHEPLHGDGRLWRELKDALGGAGLDVVAGRLPRVARDDGKLGRRDGEDRAAVVLYSRRLSVPLSRLVRVPVSRGSRQRGREEDEARALTAYGLN